MPSEPTATAGARVRFPLAWKIMLWFFLNVLFLAAVATIVAQVHLRLGVNALLSGQAAERLETLSLRLRNQLDRRPVSEWPPLLKELEADYHLQIAVFRNEGILLAGDLGPLPEEVRARLGDRDRPPDRRPPLGPPHGNEAAGLEEFAGPPRRGGPPPEADDTRNPRDKFILRAGSPPAYWIGMRTRLLDPSGRPLRPTTVILKARTINAGGLLFDYQPLLLAAGAVLICSIIFWLPLVRGITRSVRRMTQAAGAIADGNFDTWVEGRRSDELGRLGTSLNHMALRLREFFSGQKRFLGDIAHELCSPLARMEMALGVLDQRADDKQRPYIEDVRDEVRQMSTLVNELLSFSKAGVRGREVELVPVSLAALAREVLAREAGMQVEIVCEIDETMRVQAEPELLARAFGNVIRNAIRYAAGAGVIHVGALVRGEEIVLSVTDSGPGVPPETLHRLFDPFFRPEAARTREGGGVGLGLAIVKSGVEACGGSVSVRNVTPHGLQVELRLKRAA